MPTSKHLLFFSIFFCSFDLEAQLRLYPISHRPPHPTRQFRTIPDTLNLPFFDDFSHYLSDPDTNVWQNSQDVFINNGFSVHHPTTNMATFDGLNAKGQAYVKDNPIAVGYNDKLVSLPLFLGRVKDLKTLNFHFWWEAQGRGEQPNEGDSLILQIKTRQETWVYFWSVSGQAPASLKDQFNQVTLSLRDRRFFYDGFQFRFVNYGRQTGVFDHWNLDYIYVYDSAADKPNQRVDVALSGNPLGLFKDFYALPLDQFKAAPQRFLSDTITVKLNNLTNLIPSPVRLNFSITDTATGRRETNFSLQTASKTPSSGDIVLLLQQESAKFSALNRPDFYKFDQQTQLRYSFIADAVENTPTSPNFIIPTKRNDTLTAFNPLTDYFAYDDGTAEISITVNLASGSLAQRFVLVRPDTLTHIDIYFPSNPIASSETFDLFVWKTLSAVNDKNDEILFQRNLILKPSDSLNAFQRYKLTQDLVLTDTFYIGVRQRSQVPLILGFDMNRDNGSQIFSNIASRWEQNTKLKGSIMLRPVFQTKQLITNLPKPKLRPSTEFLIYPNPAANFFKIRTAIPIQKLEVYNLKGVLMIAIQNLSGQDNQIDLQYLTPNPYIVLVELVDGQILKSLLIHR